MAERLTEICDPIDHGLPIEDDGGELLQAVLPGFEESLVSVGQRLGAFTPRTLELRAGELCRGFTVRR